MATENGKRWAESIVRSLEQVQTALEAGGYECDYSTISMEGASVLREIAGTRNLSTELRKGHGGVGAMGQDVLLDQHGASGSSIADSTINPG